MDPDSDFTFAKGVVIVPLAVVYGILFVINSCLAGFPPLILIMVGGAGYLGYSVSPYAIPFAWTVGVLFFLNLTQVRDDKFGSLFIFGAVVFGLTLLVLGGGFYVSHYGFHLNLEPR